MNGRKKLVSRREMLTAALALGGYAVAGPAGSVFATERRQVHDLPPQKVTVNEHQAQTKVCGRCGAKNKGEFPVGVQAPIQYGAGVKSVAAYLMG